MMHPLPLPSQRCENERSAVRCLLPGCFLAFGVILVLALSPLRSRADAPDLDATVSPMRSFIEHEAADLDRLEYRYELPASDSLPERLKAFYNDELAKLDGVDFNALDQTGKVDYLLMHDKLVFQIKESNTAASRLAR